MARKENKMMRRRLINAYASSIVSISLVLILTGIATFLIVNAGSVSKYFKENMQISVIMKQHVTDEEAQAWCSDIKSNPFIRSTTVVGKAQGEDELKAMLGDDFLSVFESSPVPVSVDVTLQAEYVSPDSLEMVKSVLSKSDMVEEVDCQQSLVEALNTNLTRISLILGVFIILLLFISYVLINNTVRLSVFARRFTVHTMKLVGATRAFIRRPFIRSAVLQGLMSSVVAVAALYGIFCALRASFSQLFSIVTMGSLLMVAGIVVLAGVLICVLSTFFVVNRLVSLGKDELYY